MSDEARRLIARATRAMLAHPPGQHRDALVDFIEYAQRLERELSEARTTADNNAMRANSFEMSLRRERERAELLEADIEFYRARIPELEAENARLHPNAERYEWLKARGYIEVDDVGDEEAVYGVVVRGELLEEDLAGVILWKERAAGSVDAAIDAARKP